MARCWPAHCAFPPRSRTQSTQASTQRAGDRGLTRRMRVLSVALQARQPFAATVRVASNSSARRAGRPSRWVGRHGGERSREPRARAAAAATRREPRSRHTRPPPCPLRVAAMASAGVWLEQDERRMLHAGGRRGGDEPRRGSGVRGASTTFAQTPTRPPVRCFAQCTAWVTWTPRSSTIRTALA